MRFAEIDRLAPDTRFEVFFDNYFVPNIPVVITDVSTTWPASKKWTREYLATELRRQKIEVNKLWFSADDTFLRDDYEIPDIVGRCLDPAISHTRRNNVRVWINDRDHLTPFHSDTNGLYVFNVQIEGTKRWQLLAPDAPVRLYAFTQFPHLRYNTDIPPPLASHAMEFRLQRGEMLFLPAFWFHKVVSESDSVNLNWVGTRLHQADNRLHRREREILKAALALRHVKGMNRLIDLLVGTNERDYLHNYAGSGGLEFVRSLTAEVTAGAALRRLLSELVQLPLLARDISRVRQYQQSPLQALAERASARG